MRVTRVSSLPSTTLPSRSSTIRSCIRETAWRLPVICEISVSRLASSTLALREVCTAAVATRTPKTTTTTAAIRRGVPRDGSGASPDARRSATWR